MKEQFKSPRLLSKWEQALHGREIPLAEIELESPHMVPVVHNFIDRKFVDVKVVDNAMVVFMRDIDKPFEK